MEIIPVSPRELADLREVQIRPRWGWPARFSCNESGRVWPFTRLSRTPESERVYLEGAFPILDQIVQRVVRITKTRGKFPSGGRFLVDDEGVVLADGDEQIIEFLFEEDDEFSIVRAWLGEV
ncbi:MAG: hypothetical protein OXJ55_18640 [Caldilineaceae bacterium]|nr:hypothetical protein [Caldilineaceae bacterium]